MKTVSITLEPPLLLEVDRWVKKGRFGGRSEVIRQAVREWLRKKALERQLKREIAGYQKKPVAKDEFALLIEAQEWPE